MKRSILLLFLSLLLIPLSSSAQQKSFDPKQAKLVAYAHFKTSTPAEHDQLVSKALAGEAEAQYWFGTIQTEGKKPENLEEGARWLLKSAEQGYAPAELACADLCKGSWSKEKWMLRAAEHGDTDAQFWLGVGYEQNWFGTVNIQEAIKWYQKAAEGGDPDAQVELGQKYEEGEGVVQNYRLAAEWYLKAAEHVPNLGGAGQGRNRLGSLYMQGLGVPRDYVQAYFWFRLDGEGDISTDAREHLSPAEIRGVERLRNEWKVQHKLSPEVAAAIHVLEAKPR